MLALMLHAGLMQHLHLLGTAHVNCNDVSLLLARPAWGKFRGRVALPAPGVVDGQPCPAAPATRIGTMRGRQLTETLRCRRTHLLSPSNS